MAEYDVGGDNPSPTDTPIGSLGDIDDPGYWNRTNRPYVPYDPDNPTIIGNSAMWMSSGSGGSGEDPEGGGGVGGGSGNNYADAINQLLSNFRNPYGAEAMALAKEQIAYASRRLKEIEEARKLGDRTGTLTSDEKRMFQEMEDSAVANLKSQVNSQTQDVWNTALSDLVNRGVLQGTVGEKILTGISSENVRTIAEGTNTIRGTTNANMLNMQEGNKNRALTWDSMLSQESLGLLGYGSDLAKSDLNAQLQVLGFGVNANLTFAGLETQESIAAAGLASSEAEGAENRALQTALTNLQLQSQWNIANLNASTSLATAGMSSAAAIKASMYNAAGNLTAFGAGLVAKYGPSIINYMNSYNSTGSTGSTGTTGSYSYEDPDDPYNISYDAY